MPTGRKPSGGPVRHANPTYRFTEYPNEPYDGPIPVDPDPAWPLETMQWWGFVCRMPHVRGWGATDWQFAKDTGHLHAIWTETRRTSVLPEMRMREARMGTTADARMSIRVRWVDADGSDADGNVVPIRKISG